MDYIYTLFTRFKIFDSVLYFRFFISEFCMLHSYMALIFNKILVVIVVSLTKRSKMEKKNFNPS